MPELTRSLHPGPRPGRAALGPVDDVQIDVVDPESLQAAFDLPNRVLPRRKELGGDEDLLARDTALAQPLSDAFLVAVGLCRIDVSVPDLERPADGVRAFAAARHLPDAKAEQRALVAGREHAAPSVGGHHA